MSVKLRTKELADGRRSYYLDIYHKGKRQYRFLNLYHEKDNRGGQNNDTRKLAEQIRAEYQLRLSRVEHGGPDMQLGGPDRSFVDYFAACIATKSTGTRVAYSATLRHVKLFGGGENIRFAEIDQAWVERWRAYLVEKLGQNSGYHHFSVVKSILRRAVRERIITENPCDRVDRIQQLQTVREYLTSEEVSALAATDCAEPEIKRAFLFACYTGLRLSDVKALTWSRIRDGRISFRQQKTSAVEYFKLHATALALIGEPGQPDALVFTLPNGPRINRVLKIWAKAAEIDKSLNFHMSRHTFATMLLTYDVDIATVSKLLGHCNIATTLIYAKVVNKKIDRAVDSLPAIAATRPPTASV